MVVAADDVRDAHQRVVDGDDVVVDRHAGETPLAERTRIGSLTVSPANSTVPRTRS